MSSDYKEMLDPDVFTRPRRPWAIKVNLKQFLHRKDLSLESAAESMRLELIRPIERWADRPIVNPLSDIREAYKEDLVPYLNDLVEAGKNDDVEGFDNALSSVYDFCDEYRIWCG